VTERALGAGKDRVVVREDGAGGALTEEVAVDASGAGDEPVRRGAGDQVVELAPAALRRNREAAVLDEAATVDEVLDVLARGAPAGGVAALDRLRTRRVLGQRASRQQFGKVGPFPLGHGRDVPRSSGRT
jgi:hypothetical protein